MGLHIVEAVHFRHGRYGVTMMIGIYVDIRKCLPKALLPRSLCSVQEFSIGMQKHYAVLCTRIFILLHH